MNSGLLYVLILIGILALLLLACVYLARSQKTPNPRSESWLDPLRSKGIGPVLDATEQLNRELSAGKQRVPRKEGRHK